jgi:hypothetical protein
VAARVGAYGGPGCLWARIDNTGSGIVYRVAAIILIGPSSTLADARAGHRYMIWAAATMARQAGYTTFTFYGDQANMNFRAHADRLAQSVGVPGSGKTGPSSGGYADYQVTLDVSKVLT